MIYVVDDATDYRFLVQQVFRLFLPQYPLRLFSDGIELIQQVEMVPALPAAERPQLILLDVDMPKLSGTQTLERLRQHAGWSTIPVVMLSNRGDDAFVRACYERGASSFLLKPLTLDQMKAVMSLLCHYWIDLNHRPNHPVNQTNVSR